MIKKFAFPTLLAGWAIAMTLTTGCNKNESAPSVIQNETKTVTQPKINFNVAITVGNHTYLPLNLDRRRPADVANVILTILDTFEKTHPNLKVTNWHIEKNQLAYTTGAYIFGLWIDHEPRIK
ncbi:MAG: hypothetical protein Q8P76_00905 [bacterium]|nr:hypothetical protein [bacterium]